MTTNTSEILDRFRAGDEAAAEELFSRYVSRLTLFARSRLTPKLAARTDPEDVVMSAYRSFFIRARNGQFVLQRSGDLWRLLISITNHKLLRQRRAHFAEKRSVTSEVQLTGFAEYTDAREPTPEEAVAVADELETLMETLDSFGRRVLELRLQEENLAAIAEDTGRSERTVRRKLATLRKILSDQLELDAHE